MAAPPGNLELFGEPLGEAADEDCLRLNIWTPAADSVSRPVLVYLHGGGFLMGSGAAPVYDGTSLARGGDVVVVTVNHRLGILGFMHLAELLGDDYRGSGNAGLLDIVMALEWVRDNISSFGGDPRRITLCGQSGGGWKVCSLMAMPAARTLFRGAIVMSGPKLFANTSTAASRRAEGILEVLGLTANCRKELANIDVEDLLAAQTHPVPGTDADFSPVVDGDHLPLHPVDALEAGAVPDVPLLLGTTRHEHTRMLHLMGADLLALCPDDRDVERRLSPQLGDLAHEVVVAYRRSRPEASATELYVAIATDQWMRIPAIAMAERIVARGASPVFMYLFAWESPVFGGALRAIHGSDLSFMFDNVDIAAVTGDDPARHRLAAEMSGAWLSFVHHGDPSNPSLPPWPAYDTYRRATMVFGYPSEVALDPAVDERRAWAGVGRERLGLLSMPV